MIGIYKFIGKKDSMYEMEQKLNANCPKEEKNGVGPGSCGGSKGKSKNESFSSKPSKSVPEMAASDASNLVNEAFNEGISISELKSGMADQLDRSWSDALDSGLFESSDEKPFKVAWVREYKKSLSRLKEE